jgi:hypothetical protein
MRQRRVAPSLDVVIGIHLRRALQQKKTLIFGKRSTAAAPFHHCYHLFRTCGAYDLSLYYIRYRTFFFFFTLVQGRLGRLNRPMHVLLSLLFEYLSWSSFGFGHTSAVVARE